MKSIQLQILSSIAAGIAHLLHIIYGHSCCYYFQTVVKNTDYFS